MTERPFKHLDFDTLERLCRQSAGIPHVLAELVDELRWRGTQRAVALADRYSPQTPGKEGDGGLPTLELSHTPASDGSVQRGTEDPGHGLIAAILTVRRKLLDLSLRNPLLSFPRRRTAIRVIAELPDGLFRQLMDGQDLRLEPVPRRFGRDGVPVEMAAREAGIDPNLDMPLVESPEPVGPMTTVTDRAIQTLHYPEELDKLAGKLTKESRLLLEETGSNLLQLSFGFLEWRDVAEGRERLAPLILLPVQLTRTITGKKRFAFSLRQADEDAVSNISLQEKMREDFGVVIPEFTSDSTPADYFRAVQEAISAHEGWAVRGHVTLALLEFGKILMYKDLAPESWPTARRPELHPVIRQLFTQAPDDEGGGSGPNLIAEDADVDTVMSGPKAPSLILDADSSQTSAILDALAGSNLVVQGPPGTGKSQTIANLIAAGLAGGLRVLFLAEKRAALEVVHNRLVNAGLGHFLLELHSDRAKKAHVAEGLRARLERLRRFHPAKELESKQLELERQRAQLTDYAKALATPVGAMNETLHTAVWRTNRSGRQLGTVIEVLDQIRLDRASAWPPHEVKRVANQIDLLATVLHRLREEKAPNGRHPWSGADPERVSALDWPHLRSLLQDILRRAEDASVVEAAYCALTGEMVVLSPERQQGIERVSEGVSAVPEPAWGWLMPRLADPQVGAALRRFAGRVAAQRAGIKELHAQWPAALAHPTLYAEAREAISAARPYAPDATSLESLQEAKAGWSRLGEACRMASRYIGELGVVLERWREPTIDDLHLVSSVLEPLVGARPEAADMRHPGLIAKGACEAMSACGQDLAALRERHEVIASRLRVDLIPERGRLVKHLAAIAGTPWWGRLGTTYREARREHRAMSRAATTSREMALGDYELLLDQDSGMKRWQGEPRYVDVCGKWAQGLATPIADLHLLARWGRALEDTAVSHPVASTQMKLLWGVDTAAFELLRAAANDRRTLPALTTTLAELDGRGGMRVADSGTSLNEAGAFCDIAVGTLGHLIDLWAQLDLPMDAELQEVERLLATAEALYRDGLELAADKDASALLGEYSLGAATDIEALGQTLNAGHVLRSHLGEHYLGPWLWSAEFVQRRTRLAGWVENARSATAALQSSEKALVARLGTTVQEWHGDGLALEKREYRSVGLRAKWAMEAPETLATWLTYVNARRQLWDDGVGALLTHADNGVLPADQLPAAFEYVFWGSLVAGVLEKQASLRHLQADGLDTIRKKFAAVDRELLLANREHVAYQVDQRHVPQGNGYGPVATHTELALVAREAGKERRHIPLRQLIGRAGRALQALCPCWMMSPISVARYCEPGEVEFDLVIMDEASQLRPEDALGAICRGGRVIVVGDPKQLPPTSFFDVTLGEADSGLPPEEDLAQAIQESESILDVAASAFHPMRLLKWHYRSQHESLIDFSNQRFYDNRLIVFPAPHGQSAGLGVRFEHVPDGTYAKGVNPREAERVVEIVLDHCRTQPRRSMAIVTMNAEQRDRVQDLLDQATLRDPFLRAYIEEREGSLDSLIVKNLENIQGDERDVVLISATYGPDQAGNVYQRFGPINGPSGPRRLNVLFTRARQQVILVSSMRAGDIRTDQSSSTGTQVFKAYLEYAETGHLSHVSVTGREPDSPFEREVADLLGAHGFEVVPQLGVAGYFLDIAVRHPKRPGEFVLAVECDGASYHSARSARDRDRLRQQQLEALGWKLHRIWSTDWFLRPRAEAERLLNVLGEAVRVSEYGSRDRTGAPALE